MQEIIPEARCCDNCAYNMSRGQWKLTRCRACASKDGKTGWAPCREGIQVSYKPGA